MSNFQPFVGPDAEYYRRRTLREAMAPRVSTETTSVENYILRERVAELEQKVEQYEKQLTAREPVRVTSFWDQLVAAVAKFLQKF